MQVIKMNKKYKKVVLDNGVRLYVHGDKTMRKCFVSYTVEYGSSGEYFKFNYKWTNGQYKR